MNYADLFLATLPETVLETTALLVLIVDLGFVRKHSQKVRAAWASLLGVAGCVAASCVVPLSWTVGLQGPDGLTMLGAGGMTACLQVTILGMTALTLLLLLDTRFSRHTGEFAAVVLMAAAGALLVVAAQDLLVIFVGLELLSLGLYVLVAFAKDSAMSAEAALKYYLFGGMSAAFLLFGFSYVYGLTGSTNLYQINYAMAMMGTSPLLVVAWVCIVTGLAFKVAAAPFHLWAPDAYQGAPTPAVAFIASVSKVAGVGLLLTFSSTWLMTSGAVSGQRQMVEHWLTESYRVWQPLAVVLLVVAVASMVIGNLAALAQTSVRRLLAYSAVAHVGYLLLGIAVKPAFHGQTTAFAFICNEYEPVGRIFVATIYYIITYGLTAIAAFGAVGAVERVAGSDNLDAFLGLHRRNPLLAAVLMITFLSLAGIPPLVGFWAKFNLFAAVLQADAGVVPFALVALAVAMSCVSLYYYLQVLKRIYVMPAVVETPLKLHPVTMAVLIVVAASVVLLGCFPAVLQWWIASFGL